MQSGNAGGIFSYSGTACNFPLCRLLFSGLPRNYENKGMKLNFDGLYQQLISIFF